MPVIKDLICSRDECDHVVADQLSTEVGKKCPRCKRGTLVTYFGTRTSRNATPINSKDRVVVWQDPKTGKVSYPGRNDVPMPERYRQRGYVRVEMGSLKEIDRFSKQQGVVNERAHYNSGNGIDQ